MMHYTVSTAAREKTNFSIHALHPSAIFQTKSHQRDGTVLHTYVIHAHRHQHICQGIPMPLHPSSKIYLIYSWSQLPFTHNSLFIALDAAGPDRYLQQQSGFMARLSAVDDFSGAASVGTATLWQGREEKSSGPVQQSDSGLIKLPDQDRGWKNSKPTRQLQAKRQQQQIFLMLKIYFQIWEEKEKRKEKKAYTYKNQRKKDWERERQRQRQRLKQGHIVQQQLVAGTMQKGTHIS